MENLYSKELTTKLWVFISFLQKWRYLSLIKFKFSTQSKTRNTELVIENKN